MTGLLFGAIVPTEVNRLAVPPVRGLPTGYGGRSSHMLASIRANSTWGLGTAGLLRLAWRGPVPARRSGPQQPRAASPAARGQARFGPAPAEAADLLSMPNVSALPIPARDPEHVVRAVGVEVAGEDEQVV